MPSSCSIRRLSMSSTRRGRCPGHGARRHGRSDRRETEGAGVPEDMSIPPTVEAISAVSLVTHDMARAVRFYQALGFTVRHGGEQASFTSLHAGTGYLNLIAR